METEDINLDDQSKPVMLLGRDIRKIPCFKDSMLFGIYSSFATGLATFMFTSRVKLATNVALGSFSGVAMTFWCYCRYNYVMNKYAIAELQQTMQQARYAVDEETNELHPQDDQEKLPNV
ncbi:cytochrome c oxidase assembly protein COX20, mitochondrial [Odontomachus brunneus]|uniref:cytochrome c oxidase assembly protein COX20, mitochondrial n=1 Tax=Odontomachus brunneus TaxID=486640 RepID=UPI0013F2318A|nr:cytochrome c oxidase assembly protein COX20, mitochondrial [Odontomachus brunneus]XP_032665139.1 cytochrome c oxidase assembly protein COX20, mitochondrial [Odontomachus brunneus]XP_032665140.1 cytochrome c oxidase assembly protein COX20, mitochondrial [Odontomachus brunneus]